MNEALKEMIQQMPKLDLHCHIDGSFSVDFVRNTLPVSMDRSALSAKLQAPYDCDSLTSYLTCFDLPIQCMQTPENITAGICDIIRQCSEENIRYVELRFAPTCSINEQMTYHDVYEAAIRGCHIGTKQYGVYANIIVCAMRHHALSDNLDMLHAAMDFLGDGICALDLAGDENGYDNSLFSTLFTEARRLGMPFTIHSGECGSIQNVKLALEYGAKRVGHGIALIQDKHLMDACRDAGLGLELCPTSNYQTRAISPSSPYPLRPFLDHGLLATVNTDNRTVSHTTLTNEYILLCDRCNIRKEDLLTLYKNSVEISFANDDIKNELLKLASFYS